MPPVAGSSTPASLSEVDRSSQRREIPHQNVRQPSPGRIDSLLPICAVGSHRGLGTRASDDDTSGIDGDQRPCSVGSHVDEPRRGQRAKVVRHRRLAYAHTVDDLSDRHGPPRSRHSVEHEQPCPVGQASEPARAFVSSPQGECRSDRVHCRSNHRSLAIIDYRRACNVMGSTLGRRALFAGVRGIGEADSKFASISRDPGRVVVR